MPTQTMRTIKGRRIRLTRLDECGTPVEGPCSTIVTDGFVRVRFAPEIESGDEFTQKNAWGDFCISEKDADRIKWVVTTIELCDVDPDVVSVVGGATPIEDDDGNTVGFAVSGAANTEAFAIEVWAKQAGQACSTEGDPVWGYFVEPFVKNGRIDGEIEIANGVTTLSLVGQGFAASGWDDGPYSDKPITDPGGFPDDHLWLQQVTAEQPPDVTDGCVAYTAPT